MLKITNINILLLLWLFIESINGYFIKDVSTLKPVYKLYMDGSTDICYNQYDLLCIEDTQGDDCSQLTITGGSGGYADLIFSNGTTKIHSLYISTTLGSHSILLNSVYQINIQCQELNLNQITFKLRNDYSIVNNIIQASYEIIGSDPGFAFTGFTASVVNLENKCTFGNQYSQYVSSSKVLWFNCDYPLTNGNPNNTIQIKVSSSSTNSKVFDLESLFRDGLQLYDLTIYPNESEAKDLNLLGYYSNPLFSFKSNQTISKSYFGINSNFGKELGLNAIPIYGNQSYTTYLVSLDDQSSTSYYIYYPSQSYIYLIKSYSISTVKFTKDPYNPTISTSNYFNGLPIITFKYSVNIKKNLETIQLRYGSEKSVLSTNFPFGYISGNSNTGYNYEITSIVNSNSQSNVDGSLEFISLIDSDYSIKYPKQNASFIYDTTKIPIIYNFESIHVISDIYIYRFYVKAPYGISYIQSSILSSLNIFGSEARVQGDSFDGIYEIIVQNPYFHPLDSGLFVDQAGGSSKMISDGVVLNAYGENITRYLYNSNFQYVDGSLIQDISFLYNDIDVTNHVHYNVMYFNYPDISKDTLFTMVPIRNNYQDLTNQDGGYFSSTWNDNLGLFQIEFYVEANSPAGDYQFKLIVNSYILYSTILNTQLRIKNTNLDNRGPIFKYINQILQNNEIDNSNGFGVIGWSFTIEDAINGFKNGYIVIKGELDQSHYNFTFTYSDAKPGSTRYLGDYELKLNITWPCISQNYVIDQVKLYDTMNRVSIFSILPDSSNSMYSNVLNPFVNYLNNTSINKIPLQCYINPNTVKDTTSPSLVSFKSSTNSIDVGNSINRLVSFTFTAVDQESGLKNDVYPIVYISAINHQILECKSKIISINNVSASYSCEINLPYSFGFPGSIILSVYGFINNQGLISGYSTESLIKSNFNYIIQTIFSGGSPFVAKHSQISEKGGDLWLFGSYLNKTRDVYIKYSDDTSGTVYSTTPSNLSYSTSILVQGIKSTFKPFDIYVKTSSGTISNTITVTPTVYDFNINVCNDNGILDKNGKCICNNKWTTLNDKSPCLIANHYISTSTQVLPSTGGEITLYGWFGMTYENPSLFINNKQITIDLSTITSTSIKATIEPGRLGPVQVNYTQNSIKYSGIIYPYLATEKECPSKCEVNGECEKSTGKCICKSGWTGFDCLSPINSNGNSVSESQVGNNGATSIKNQDLGFLISIDSIVELDINNNAISTFNLTNNWIFVNKVDSTSTFIQSRTNQDLTTASINLAIEEVNDQDKEFTFAGNQFTVLEGGFKLSISISNWLYSSNLNILQIQMSSDINITPSSNNCNNNNNKPIIESSSTNNYLSNDINYLKVIKNNRVLYSRFQDKMLSNNKTTTISVQLLQSNNENSVKVALNIPSRCDDICLIDPDFSLLITPDYTQCNESRKWVVAVAVVCGVLGLTVIVIGSIVIYKRSTFLKIKVYSFKKYYNSNK